MPNLVHQIMNLAVEELTRTNHESPSFRSEHESVSVLREKIEEASEEMKYVEGYHDTAWKNVTRNLPPDEQVKKIKDRAIFLAAAAVQVVAMAYKFESFLQDKKGEKKDESKTTASE